MADTTLNDALSLLTTVSSELNDRITALEKAVRKTTGVGVSNVKNQTQRIVEEAKPVIIADLGVKAKQDFKDLLQTPSAEGGKDDEPEKGGMGFIKKIIGPALLVLGGLAALVTGLMSDGPLKGLLNILSKGGIIGGVKLFQKMASKQLAKFTGLFAKIIPKDLFTGVIKKAKGFLGSITKFLLKPFAKLGGKAAGKGLFGIIGKLFGKFLKPLLKRIPGIGSLISWGFAISRFKSGDLVGGLIDVASGIATLFPGIGTGISIGLDVLNAFLDAKKGKDEKVKPGGAPGGIGAFFGKIKDKIMNNYPIKNLVEFWSGAGKVFKGDFKEGFTQMAFAIPFMKPLANFLFSKKEEVNEETGEVTSTTMFAKIKEVVMNNFPIKNLMQMWGGIKNVISGNFKEGFTQMAFAIPFMKPLANFLFNEREEVDPETGEVTKKKSIMSGVKDAVMKKLQNLWKKMPRWLKWGAKKVLPDSIIEKLSGGELISDEDSEDMVSVELDSPKKEGKNRQVNGNREKSDSIQMEKHNVGATVSAADIVKDSSLDKDTFVRVNQTNFKLGSDQMMELKKNNVLLAQILEKINSGNSIITSNNTSIVNTQKSSSFRDMQFAV